MTDQADESRELPPPTDVERLQVLARVIQQRITQLSTMRRGGSFTPELARELYVLQDLRDHWILEARD